MSKELKRLEINYFAILRDYSGKTHEAIQTEAETFEDLYLELQNKYQFPLEQTFVKAAFNDEFVSIKDQIPSNGKVVFIPPVAGG